MSPPLLSRFTISAGSDAQCKKEGLGLSAADRRWRVDCVEILGGTTDICLENRYLPMCFNMAGCVARAFFIIHAETVCFLFVGTESKRRGAVPHSSRDAPYCRRRATWKAFGETSHCGLFFTCESYFTCILRSGEVISALCYNPHRYLHKMSTGERSVAGAGN